MLSWREQVSFVQCVPVCSLQCALHTTLSIEPAGSDCCVVCNVFTIMFEEQLEFKHSATKTIQGRPR